MSQSRVRVPWGFRSILFFTQKIKGDESYRQERSRRERCRVQKLQIAMKKQASSSYIMNRKSWRRRSSLLSVLKRMFRGVVRVGRGRLQATHDEHNEVNCHAKHETQSKGGGHQHGDMLSAVFFNIAFLSIINRWKLKWRQKRVIFMFLVDTCNFSTLPLFPDYHQLHFLGWPQLQSNPRPTHPP